MTQLKPSSTTPANSHRSRRRGLLLTHQGWGKLLEIGVIYNPVGDRRSLEELSERTLLDPRTIYRIIGRELGVDKRTLKTFFAAFDLQLEPEDCTFSTTNAVAAVAISEASQNFASLPLYTTEEITYLKQCIIKDCSELSTLLQLNQADHKTLSVKLSSHAPPQVEINVRQSC